MSAAVQLPTLVGRRCTLRPLRLADAPSLQRHADDPAVADNLFDGFPQPCTLESRMRLAILKSSARSWPRVH